MRDFADGPDPALQASLVESFRQDRDSVADAGKHGNDPINILALSGGGAEGAFGAGLLCGWSAAGTRPEFKLVTGVSTGALIAPYAFLGSSQDEALKRVYTTIRSKDVYRKRSMVELLLGSESLMDTTPLENLITRDFDASALAAVAAEHRKGRRLLVGTTNMDAGKFVIWDMGAIACSENPAALQLFRDILRASAAIPLAFPPTRFPVEAQGQVYDEEHADGGVCTGVFLFGFALDWKHAQIDAGLTPRAARLFVIRNGQIASLWSIMATRDKPAVSTTKGLIGASIVGDLYRIYAIALREGIAFNLASIPEDYIPAGKEPFDRVEMNRLFNLAFESARNGYDWQLVPPGIPSDATRLAGNRG